MSPHVIVQRQAVTELAMTEVTLKRTHAVRPQMLGERMQSEDRGVAHVADLADGAVVAQLEIVLPSHAHLGGRRRIAITDRLGRHISLLRLQESVVKGLAR